MMLEQKQEKLLAAVEAAGYRFVKEEGNSRHLQFIPDGTHRGQGDLFAKSWNEVERMGRSSHRKRRFDPKGTRGTSIISGAL